MLVVSHEREVYRKDKVIVVESGNTEKSVDNQNVRTQRENNIKENIRLIISYLL